MRKIISQLHTSKDGIVCKDKTGKYHVVFKKQGDLDGADTKAPCRRQRETLQNLRDCWPDKSEYIIPRVPLYTLSEPLFISGSLLVFSEYHPTGYHRFLTMPTHQVDHWNRPSFFSSFLCLLFAFKFAKNANLEINFYKKQHYFKKMFGCENKKSIFATNLGWYS